MEYWKKAQIPTYVVGRSLIGVWGEAPHAWGNYCWVAPKGVDGRGHVDRSEHISVLNMWAENIEAASIKFALGNSMEALVYKNMAIVIDSRIPTNWRHDKLCFTGSGIPAPSAAERVEIMREAYDYIGDPNYELEQFIDPFLYHARRGQIFKPSTYIVNGVSYESGAIWMGADAKIEAKKILEERGIV